MCERNRDMDINIEDYIPAVKAEKEKKAARRHAPAKIDLNEELKKLEDEILPDIFPDEEKEEAQEAASFLHISPVYEAAMEALNGNETRAKKRFRIKNKKIRDTLSSKPAVYALMILVPLVIVLIVLTYLKKRPAVKRR